MMNPIQSFSSFKAERNEAAQVVAEENLKKEYGDFFMSLLKKYGVSSPAELDDEKKKEFFDEVQKGWKEGEGQVEEEINSPENPNPEGFPSPGGESDDVADPEDEEEDERIDAEDITAEGHGTDDDDARDDDDDDDDDKEESDDDSDDSEGEADTEEESDEDSEEIEVEEAEDVAAKIEDEIVAMGEPKKEDEKDGEALVTNDQEVTQDPKGEADDTSDATEIPAIDGDLAAKIEDKTVAMGEPKKEDEKDGEALVTNDQEVTATVERRIMDFSTFVNESYNAPEIEEIDEADQSEEAEEVNENKYARASKLGYNDQFLDKRTSLSKTLSTDLDLDPRMGVGFDYIDLYDSKSGKTILANALKGDKNYDEILAAAKEFYGK